MQIKMTVPPLVIIDYRVIVWSRMLFAYKRLPEFSSQEERSLFLSRAWQYVLQSPSSLPYSRDRQLVIVDDGSTADTPYWRVPYLAERGFPVYKGQRKPKPESWSSVANYGYKAIESLSLPYLRVEGFEADDLAAEFIRQHSLAKQLVASLMDEAQARQEEVHIPPELKAIADRQIFLHTVDTDWLQLVSDSVTWINVAHHKPRVRGLETALGYINKKFSSSITDPSEIVDLKVKYGDSSDNLPKGSPREVIDLFNPPEQYNLKNHDISDRITQLLAEPEANVNHPVRNAAKSWLLSSGYLRYISH